MMIDKLKKKNGEQVTLVYVNDVVVTREIKDEVFNATLKLLKTSNKLQNGTTLEREENLSHDYEHELLFCFRFLKNR